MADREEAEGGAGKKSGWSEVTSGVVQGSCLGPTLFLILINTIDNAMDTTTAIISKFADDTKAGRVVENEDDRAKLQEEINNLVAWTEKWQMQFNASKCSIMHLGSKNPNFSYTMGGYAPAGVVLETTVEEKDVGVMIRNDLKPSSQCAKAAKKANSVLGQMARAFHYRDKETWPRLYKTYIRCHLEYCVQAWSPYTVADKELLEKVQRRAVGMISGLTGGTYEERLAECGLTTLEERRTRGDLIQTWKIIHGIDSVERSTWFQMVADEDTMHRTRLVADKTKLVKPKWKHKPREQYFSVRVVDRWNELPQSVREAKTINTFKNMYDEWKKN